MTLLYDGPHIQVIERPGSSDYALVTFAEMGTRADGRTIWGRSLVEKRDLHALGFVAKAANWYPAADLARACAAALPALARFGTRIGYGFSQGGYAAIKASRPLALSHTIAVSPQASIDPADVADDRFRRFFRPELHAGMRVAAGDAPRALHLFYDRAHRDDREQAELILAAVPGAAAHAMPFTDHDTILAFADSAAFPRLVEAVIAGRPQAVAARMRRDSAVRRAVMVQRALRRGRTDRAFAIFDAAGFAPLRRLVLLADLAEAGAVDRVLPLAEAELANRPDDPLAHAVLALTLAALGRRAEARRHLAAATRDRPRARVQDVVARTERLLADPPGWSERAADWMRRIAAGRSGLG